MDDRPLLVLLLPGRLEALPRRDLAESLLATADGVMVEPARFGPERLPLVLATGAAGMQARRMRLPGTPRVVVLLAPDQYLLARALIAANPGCELWYGPSGDADGDLHDLAAARAALVFDDTEAGRSRLAAAIEAAGLRRR